MTFSPGFIGGPTTGTTTRSGASSNSSSSSNTPARRSVTPPTSSNDAAAAGNGRSAFLPDWASQGQPLGPYLTQQQQQQQQQFHPPQQQQQELGASSSSSVSSLNTSGYSSERLQLLEEKREVQAQLLKDERRLRELKALIMLQQAEVARAQARLAWISQVEANLEEEEGEDRR
jgi:hypothetical protein